MVPAVGNKHDVIADKEARWKAQRALRFWNNFLRQVERFQVQQIPVLVDHLLNIRGKLLRQNFA